MFVSAGLILILLCVFGSTALQCPYCHSASDRIFYAMFWREDTTTFSSGYTEVAFERVTVGMPREAVQELLGGPLQTMTPGSIQPYNEIWRYSKGEPGANFWFRNVYFKDGKVLKTESKYFVD